MSTAYVEMTIDLSQIGEYELIEELESRGYVILGEDVIESLKYELNRNDLRECMIQLERHIPEVRGLVHALDKLTNTK